jgi:hypothetical protein
MRATRLEGLGKLPENILSCFRSNPMPSLRIIHTCLRRHMEWAVILFLSVRNPTLMRMTEGTMVMVVSVLLIRSVDLTRVSSGWKKVPQEVAGQRPLLPARIVR